MIIAIMFIACYFNYMKPIYWLLTVFSNENRYVDTSLIEYENIKLSRTIYADLQLTAPLCRYSGVWLMTRCGMLYKLGYNINNWGVCLAVLFLYGFVFRCIAFVCLVMLNKK